MISTSSYLYFLERLLICNVPSPFARVFSRKNVGCLRSRWIAVVASGEDILLGARHAEAKLTVDSRLACVLVPVSPSCSTTREPPDKMYESLIACISMAASHIGIRSLGCCFEQDKPSPMTEIKHSSILSLCILSLASSCTSIVGSAISKILSGRAASENL